MRDEAWGADQARAVTVFLNGDAIPEPDRRGEEIVDDSFLILFNGQPDPATFTLPDGDFGAGWTAVIDTDSQIETGSTVTRGRADAAREVDHRVHPSARHVVAASSGIGVVATASREAAKQAKKRRVSATATEDKPKRRTTRPRPTA